MTSSSITRISYALDDLELLKDEYSGRWNVAMVEDWLRFLRTFLLCARAWGKDEVHLASDDKKNEVDNHQTSLEALVVRIENTIPWRALEIRDICCSSGIDRYFPVTRLVSDIAEKDIISLRQEICEWYVFFSDCSSKQSSTDLLVRKDDIMEFTDSLLENLVYFHSLKSDEEQYEADLIKALEEQLKFWKNFSRFVTQPGVEDAQLGPLLTHIKAVAIDAARFFSRCKFMKVDELQDDMNTSILELLLKIIRIEPHVQETYVEALIASKLSRQSLGDTDEQILRDFVDSLACNLGEILKSGLVILFLSLKAIKDSILSKNMDLVSSGLLKKINLMETVVAQRYPESASFNFLRTNSLGFIDSLLEKMKDLTNTKAGSIAFTNHPIQTVQEELVCLRSFLGEIVELRNEDEELQAIWDRVAEVAYRVEFFIDSLMVGDDLDSSSMSFHPIVEEIKIIKAETLQICDSEKFMAKLRKQARDSITCQHRGVSH